jgi:DNA-binding NarL/FixJ family response regulator
MLVRGHPNKTICAKLGMSPNTVKTHLRVIFRELRATTRTEAATEALRRWPDCGANVDGA